ncbi:hypothetical protein H4582DRAFT_1279052 [Lactarius indigo]|nr:hypothetical protein H4582DRAFT_1279052 [Lactarius indigo]
MYSSSIPSTSPSTPPGPLPDGTSSPDVGFVPVQSRRRQRLHQPAAIYDATFDLYSRDSSEHQGPSLTEHIYLPSSSIVTQQSFQPAAPYPSPMSRHNGWAHPNYTQWHPSGSSTDAQAAAAASSSTALSMAHKAVLLLRPHVPLYSTDALPVNCSAYSAQPPSLDPSRRRANERQPRTCECLTQTLCCHGCGSNVGYMIVFPCARCTSSISATNRVTNGHRFVFHSSELVASERHYAPDGASLRSPSTAPPALNSAYSTMPPPAPESPCPVPSSEFAEPLKPSPQPLRVGDLLYWHHLTRSGEIPGATDDRRARGINTVLFDR